MMTMNKNQIPVDISVELFFKQTIWDFKKYPDEEIAKFFSRKTPQYSRLDTTPFKGTPLETDMRDLYKCMLFNGIPYKYTSKCFPYIFLFPQFLLQHGYTCFADITDVEKTTTEWLAFWETRGKKYLHDLEFIIKNIKFTILEYRDTRTGLDRNYWYIEDISINDERLDKTKVISNMNFWEFRADDREYYKIYFRHLLGGTELSYSTIFNRYAMLVNFSHSVKTPLLEVTHDEICNYAVSFSDNRKNQLLSCIQNMLDYLAIKNIFTGKNPISKTDFAKRKIKYIQNTVPEEIFIEFFKHIQELPSDLLLIFLIDAFTGIRISDICQLKLDCLCKTKNGYFIFHSIQKMQDVGGIPISKELYELVQQRIDYIKSLNYKETYLFPSVKKRNHPYNTGTYRNVLKRYTKKWGITTSSGETYNFVTHAFRHTISTELYNMGMSPTLIQLGVLHHTEINMSRHYIELNTDTHKKMLREKMDEEHFINQDSITPTDAILPNGYCNMPAKLSCPNLSSCLTCQFFRTSIKFLDIHKEQLRQFKEQLTYFENNNFQQNAVIAKKQISILETIVASLEQIKEDDTNEQSTT